MWWLEGKEPTPTRWALHGRNGIAEPQLATPLLIARPACAGSDHAPSERQIKLHGQEWRMPAGGVVALAVWSGGVPARAREKRGGLLRVYG